MDIEFYHNNGISEGFYGIHLLNDVVNQSEQIRQAYVAGFAQGKMLRNTLTEAQNFIAEKQRLEYIRNIGYQAGYGIISASEENLKDENDIKVFKHGFEAGNYTKQIENYVKEKAKGSSR